LFIGEHFASDSGGVPTPFTGALPPDLTSILQYRPSGNTLAEWSPVCDSTPVV